MNNSINFKNLNNILLYKKAFDKFISVNKIIINNISDIDYLIPILFLTEMNRYCKNNKISIHGYYIAQGLLMLYMNLKNNMLFNKEINYIIIINFYKNISLNIEYLNTRIDDSNLLKKKINYNYHNLIIEISNLIEEILISENKNTFIDFLSKFFYILLILAKFIGTGEIIKVPNLIKLGEYYGNLFTCCILLENNISNYNLQDLFEKYINYKSILIESIYNNNYYSDTIDEIIKYIDIYITKNLK
jgi:hypothetical protein